MTLLDTMMQAQNGQAMQTMARQFGLSEPQTQAAVEALMPAFSTGLKRSTADPAGIGAFMEALSTGKYLEFFEDMGKAFQPAGIDAGNGVLGQLFGSKDLSRAVAHQAEQATGIGQHILKQMLPVIATTLMGGMFKQSAEEAHKPQTTGNPFFDMFTGMMQVQKGTGHPAQSAGDTPFGRMLEQMTAANQTGQPNPAAQNPSLQNPSLQNSWADILAQMTGMSQPEPEPEKPAASNPYADMFGQMFETGRKTQQTYQRGMDDIFDQYLKGMDRKA